MALVDAILSLMLWRRTLGAKQGRLAPNVRNRSQAYLGFDTGTFRMTVPYIGTNLAVILDLIRAQYVLT